MLKARKDEAMGKGSQQKESSLGELALGGHDLLSALVKANLDAGLPDSQRLSDEDVLNRECQNYCKLERISSHEQTEIPTFLLAGHETTA